MIEKVAYGGWPNCYRLSNNEVDLVVTTDVGPRIIRFGFRDADNEFKEFAGQLGRTGGDEWRIYGGHRLWHAPEDAVRTYQPDNSPVQFEELSGFARVIQPTEARTGIQKEIDIHLAPDSAHVRLTHRLHNAGLWPVELAPWALSALAPGGTAILPLPPRGTHPEQLLPTSTLTLWAFTDMSDPRWTWGRKYILLRADPRASSPQKIGVSVPDGWAAYARRGHLFVVTFHFRPEARYPDLGCSVESFTNAEMLELETLGPVTVLAPGASIEHVEDWHLWRGVPEPASDEAVERDILPRLTNLPRV